MQIELRLVRRYSHGGGVGFEIDLVAPRKCVLWEREGDFELARHAGGYDILAEGDFVEVDDVFSAGDGPDEVDF